MNAPATDEPAFAEVKIRRALRETEPLLDPVKVAVGLIQSTVALAVPLALLNQFVKIFGFALSEGVLSAFLWAALLTILYIPVAILLAPLPSKILKSMLLYQNGVPVYYLRAFRSDRVSARLRRKLQAILGRDSTIAGIRPPAKRAGMLYRLFFTVPTGLRYLGSTSFRLEAGDHNWLSRLLASFSRGRFVFIDLRDVTPHVADEIQMSYLAMGIERCVFITDTTRSDPEWRELIASFVQDCGVVGKPLFTIAAPGEAKEDLKRFAFELRSIMTKIPSGFPTISWRALQFARSRVSKWSSLHYETEAGLLRLALRVEVFLFVASVALACFDVFSRQHIGEDLIAYFVVLSFIVLALAFVSAICRGIRQRWFVARNRAALRAPGF